MTILNKIKSFFGVSPKAVDRQAPVRIEGGGSERVEEVPEQTIPVAQKEIPPVAQSPDEATAMPEQVVPAQKQKAEHVPKIKKAKRAIASIRDISLDIYLENLDEAGEVMAVQGSGSEQYLVDLATLSCTCMDFVKTRSTFAHNDIRRLCKHQTAIIAASSQEVEAEEILQAMLKGLGGKSFQRYALAVEVSLNEKIEGPDVFYLFREEGRDWVDVLILTDGSLRKYGFNLKKKQWSGKANPFPKASRGKYSRAMQIALQD
ncbi:hypothetical protein [Desulfotalea psychrophila]|uniref:SWIM-type domain-containing protein n=1 Tax=Desulfotalea psychrophila (strain LSv54 / DSM 12343) TaxID=177439 RepID=Q6AQY5_DESPS|nr:hypothetical protein [Desulfotalea psychrophila]CAG35239.1 unknown protein [Desulfotalea psychrophila LSv54]